MKLKKVVIFSYRLPMKNYFDFRKGLIIEATTIDNDKRYGEVAPLDGFSKECFKDAKKELIQYLSNCLGKITLRNNLHPSVYFGLFSLFFKNTFVTSNYSQLLDNDFPILNGRFAKLKVKGLSISQIFKKIKTINSNFPELRIHLDCNRSWKINELIEFSKLKDETNIHYIEEPTDNIEEVLKNQPRFPFKFAQDESLRFFGTIREAYRYVIKPTMQGGFLKILKQFPEKTVLSSSFETPVGLRSIIAISNQYHCIPEIGIDTMKYHMDSILKSGYQYKDGICSIEPIHLNYEKLIPCKTIIY